MKKEMMVVKNYHEKLFTLDLQSIDDRTHKQVLEPETKENGMSFPYEFQALTQEEVAHDAILSIPQLGRCVGIVATMKERDSSDPHHVIIGFHIPPYNPGGPWRKYMREVCRQIFGTMKNFQRVFHIEKIILTGGKLNSPINRQHYQNSLRKYFYPIMHFVPEAKYVQFLPLPEAEQTLTMVKDGYVCVMQGKDVQQEDRFPVSFVSSIKY